MAEKNKGGRPPKLHPDEATLKIVRGLGNIQATSKECAAVLDVTEPTWTKFKADHPEVAEAYAGGSGEGLASLRRRQFKAAQDGNATMLIWLGKQYLGQADKQETALSGSIQFDATNLSDDELNALERALGGSSDSAAGNANGGPRGAGKAVH